MTMRMSKMKMKYVKIERASEKRFNVLNHNDEPLGYIELMKVGKWMHWCFNPDMDTFYTNGCLKDISKFITTLYPIRGENNGRQD